MHTLQWQSFPSRRPYRVSCLPAGTESIGTEVQICHAANQPATRSRISSATLPELPRQNSGRPGGGECSKRNSRFIDAENVRITEWSIIGTREWIVSPLGLVRCDRAWTIAIEVRPPPRHRCESVAFFHTVPDSIIFLRKLFAQTPEIRLQQKSSTEHL